jgi:hypothetical protein
LYYNSGTPAAPSWNLVGNNAGQWITNGSNIYYNSGNVGIGTNSPTAKLQVNAGDALINGLKIGQGSGNSSYSTAIGYQVLFTNSIGNYNTAAGTQALYANTTGNNNTVSSYRALYIIIRPVIPI